MKKALALILTLVLALSLVACSSNNGGGNAQDPNTDGEGDTATRVVVQTGLVSKTDTEIVSGLAEGDRVVVKGQSYLADGSMVRVVSGEDDAAQEDTAAGVTDATTDAAATDGEG